MAKDKKEPKEKKAPKVPKQYEGVKQLESGKWKYSLIKKGNKKASLQKGEFSTKEMAALHRDMHIKRNVTDKVTQSEKYWKDAEIVPNELSLSDKKYKKLMKVKKESSKGKDIWGDKCKSKADCSCEGKKKDKEKNTGKCKDKKDKKDKKKDKK